MPTPFSGELGQLRKTAQGALAYAMKTRNLVATASLLRSANGLLETVSKIEDKRAEALKAQQATTMLQPKAWKDWLREMEPSVRKKWEELFEKAGPALLVWMMEDFFGAPG